MTREATPADVLSGAARWCVGVACGHVAAYAPFYFDGNLASGARMFVDVIPLEHALVAAAVSALGGRHAAALVAAVGVAGALRDKVMDNAARFRAGMTAAGFTIKPGIHPIVPVMLGDAVLAQKVAAALLEEGIYAIGFFFPVVPKGEARIRVQLSAVHEDADIDRAVAAFTRVGKGLGVV